jgi:hypothetical protein
LLTRHSQKCGGIVELVLADLWKDLSAISYYHEPVIARGPFVMNTRARIVETFSDYSAGPLILLCAAVIVEKTGHDRIVYA